ncbi:MAG: methionine--tRNA ligase [Candidatus Ryanbacteria bacterium]|nr:methionine--tRNA ligase [Candidatus Ryanbacteria bacterium]
MDKKFYVTTPIFYVNAAPHLGHAYADVVADTLARWHRARGEATFFLSGTDEHGAKIVRAAEKANVSTKEFVEKHRDEFKKLLASLGAQQDDFIYTSDSERHWPGAEAFWKKLVDADDLYKATYEGLYCVGHEAFVTEKDLVDGKCADHNQTPEKIAEENYFFRLSKYKDRIKSAIASDEMRIMPESRKKEILAFLEEGAVDISFSRPSKDISWGIPVPGDREHTMYVWADALTNYISALGYGRGDDTNFKTFWPADAHIIGKDILRFHAAIWPGMLLSAGLPLPKMLLVTGMIRSGGQKMSKTLGNVIDPTEFIDQYGKDAFRYFLLREIPLGEDGDFTRERFRDVYEGNLAHGMGNLVSRTAAMINKYFEGHIEAPSAEALAGVPTRRVLKHEVLSSRVSLDGSALNTYFERDIAEEFSRAMFEYRLTDAITILSSFFSLLDGYIQDYEPYRLVKTDPDKTKAVLWNVALHIIRAAKLLESFMPSTAEKIVKVFGTELKQKEDPTSIHITLSEALFPSKADGPKTD